MSNQYTGTAIAGQPALIATSSVAEDAVIITCTTSSNALSSINSSTGYAIKGTVTSATGNTTAIYADATATSGWGTAFYGVSTNGNGLFAQSDNQDGIHARSKSAAHSGIWADNTQGGYGVAGSTFSITASAVIGTNSGGGPGVSGVNTYTTGAGVYGTGVIGVKGATSSVGGTSVMGVGSGAGYSYGVWGECNFANSVAVFGTDKGYTGCYAGDFYGTVAKTGGTFKIDHPQDPENKYLLHSFVESPDMKNVYDGVGVADTNGELVVKMPGYFESLNSDFRYQLTPLGQSAPNMYIKEELTGGKFVVAGANAGQRVSWQITGIRKDPWALKNPIVVEQDKPVHEKGYYRHPEVHGQPEEMGIHHKMAAK